MIKVSVVADSVAPHDKRITTFQLTYPRFIHAELMTHRVFSRNSSSSRAIPFKRLVGAMLESIARPLSFRANQKGMQAGAALSPVRQWLCDATWTALAYIAAAGGFLLSWFGAHKQYANRPLEPYSHITVVLTSTDFDNWFALRYHPDAQPEIAELAKQMWLLYQASHPLWLDFGEWHLPFIGPSDLTDVEQLHNPDTDQYWKILCMMSAARCARTSYLTHDRRTPTIGEDLELYDRLATHTPMHASPLEHQATPAISAEYPSGNFTGWLQFRKSLKRECVKTFKGPGDFSW